MACKISNLPIEILTEIFTFLDRCDLKNLRLLSKALDKASLPILFEDLSLRTHPQSFESLRYISQHDKLKKWVSCISYDGRMLDGKESQFTRGKITEHFNRYCKYLDTQDIVLKVSTEQEMLIEAFKKFPNLSGIHYTARQPMMVLDRVDLNSLNPIAQEIQRELDANRPVGHTNFHFWPLLQSLDLSGHATCLKKLSGSGLVLQQWCKAAKLFRGYFELLPALEEVSLEFIFDTHPDSQVFQFPNLLFHAPNLISLRLSVQNFPRDREDGAVQLSQVIKDETYWKRLEHFSLDGMITSGEYLKDFLRRHSKSLRSLEISNMRFDVMFAKETFKFISSDSWIDFIHFLGQDMTLKSMEFNGCLSNGWNEGWEVDGMAWKQNLNNHAARSRDSYLKYKIEYYITNGGPSPFTPRERLEDYDNDSNVDSEEYMEDLNYNQLPWYWNEDISWGFDDSICR